jgi:hypothetical protein
VSVPKGGQTVDIGRGRVAQFVHWHLTRDGWVPEIVEGTFLRLVKAGWVIRDAKGDELVLERDTWEWVKP